MINLQSILIPFDTVVLSVGPPPHRFSLTSWKCAGICHSQSSRNVAIVLPIVQPSEKQNTFQ